MTQQQIDGVRSELARRQRLLGPVEREGVVIDDPIAVGLTVMADLTRLLSTEFAKRGQDGLQKRTDYIGSIVTEMIEALIGPEEG